MASNFGTSNSGRHYTVPNHTDFYLSDADFAIITIFQMQASSSAPYIYSIGGSYGSGGSVNIFCYDGSNGYACKIDGFTDINWGGGDLTHGSWFAGYVTRRAGTLYVGGGYLGDLSSFSENSTSISGELITDTDLKIGLRSDQTSNSVYAFNGKYSDCIIAKGRSISVAEFKRLLLGEPLYNQTWWNNRVFHAYFSTSNKTHLVDLTGRHALTKQGSGYIKGDEYDSPIIKRFPPKNPSILIFPAISSASSFTITPSGGVVLSGTNAITFTDYIVITPSGGVVISGNNTITAQNFYEISPSGGTTFSGNNVITFTAGSNTYTITPDGGVTISGANTLDVQNFFEISPSGGIVLSGANGLTVEKAYTITPDGGVVFSGENAFIITKIIEMDGGIVFSGSNPITSNTVDVSARLPLIGVGK